MGIRSPGILIYTVVAGFTLHKTLSPSDLHQLIADPKATEPVKTGKLLYPALCCRPRVQDNHRPTHEGTHGCVSDEALPPAFTVITPISLVAKIAEAMGTMSCKVQEVMVSVGKRRPNDVMGTYATLKY